MSKAGRKKGRLMWGLIYAAAFVAVFLGSMVIKVAADPFHGKYKVVWDDTVGTVYTDLTYGEGEANKFDLYLPADNSRESYGLVVYLHGGGFTAGDKAGDREMLQWLCSKGYVAAGINYTLRSEAHPEVNVYTQSVDIRNSMPFVVDAAEKLGYPVDRMAISGGSAGGTLALLYAYRDAAEAPVPVKLVFEAVGPASFHHEDWKPYGLDQSPAAAAGLFSVMSGNPISEEMVISNSYDEQVRNISAYMWVDESAPPTVCVYGAHDKICPFGSAQHLADALAEHDIPHAYIVLPHSGHALQNDHRQYRLYMEKVEEYLAEYMGN